jgi:CDP-4-dehydro-6-deoxyglucose reductase, E3
MTTSTPQSPNTAVSNRQIYQFHVKQIIDHTPTIRELVLALNSDQSFAFKAGQFVSLHVPSDPKPVLRAYSIASSDEDPRQLRLLLKYVPEGKASTFVWSLKGSEVLNFTGPFGRVFFRDPPLPNNYYLCTSTGLAQPLCFLLSKAKKFPDIHHRLLIGVRDESDVFLENELIELCKNIPNFSFAFVLSRSEPSKAHRLKGYVQHHIPQGDLSQTQFYLCGNGDMIKQAKQILLQEKALPAQQVLAEVFH